MLEIINFEFIISITKLTLTQKAAVVLMISILLDLSTGIWANWTDFKKTKLSTTKSHFIESAKLRLTAVKFTTYAMGILGTWSIETIFFIQKIPTANITNIDLTLTTFIIGFFCTIEIYSIFFENIKRLGFDILKITKTIVMETWKLYKTFKNGSSDN